MHTIGDRIRQLREEGHYTQIDLAGKLNISNTTLSQYETNQRTPSDEVKIRICEIFNVSLDYLLGVTDKKRAYDIETIAAHHDGDDWTEEELEEIERFKEFIRSKRSL
jgi:transcriptional regulator with XRE-family HTH domain